MDPHCTWQPSLAVLKAAQSGTAQMVVGHHSHGSFSRTAHPQQGHSPACHFSWPAGSSAYALQEDPLLLLPRLRSSFSVLEVSRLCSYPPTPTPAFWLLQDTAAKSSDGPWPKFVQMLLPGFTKQSNVINKRIGELPENTMTEIWTQVSYLRLD